MHEVLYVASLVGGGFALALAAGLFLAARYGGHSVTMRRMIAMGTIVVAVILAITWVLLTGMGVCC